MYASTAMDGARSPREGEGELDLYADELLAGDLIVEELADSSALGTWTSAACFGSACGTAGTAGSIACIS